MHGCFSDIGSQFLFTRPKVINRKVHVSLTRQNFSGRKLLPSVQRESSTAEQPQLPAGSGLLAAALCECFPVYSAAAASAARRCFSTRVGVQTRRLRGLRGAEAPAGCRPCSEGSACICELHQLRPLLHPLGLCFAPQFYVMRRNISTRCGSFYSIQGFE